MENITTTRAPSLGIFSSGIASFLTALIISGNLIYRSDWFNVSPLRVLLGGYLGSWSFILTLTAISNFEMVLFGRDFQVKLMREVLISFLFAVYSCIFVHRVCVTTCILFSIIGLYYLHGISNRFYNKNLSNVDFMPQTNRRSAKLKSK